MPRPTAAPRRSATRIRCHNRAAQRGQAVGVTYRNRDLPPGAGIFDLEMGKMDDLCQFPWLTDTSVDCVPRGNWAYSRSAAFKSPERLIHNLVDGVSKNGPLLLNVGPRADGAIPEGAKRVLKKLGAWLRINGEAIYDTRPWCVAGEGPTSSAVDMSKGGVTSTRPASRGTARMISASR